MYAAIQNTNGFYEAFCDVIFFFKHNLDGKG